MRVSIPKLALTGLLLLPLLAGPSAQADEVATHFQKAGEAMNQKNWDLALDELAAVLAADKQNVKAHIGRAKIFASPAKNDVKAAITELNQVLEIDPKLAGAYQMRSELLNRVGERDKARADMLSYLRLAPQGLAELSKAAQQAMDDKQWARALYFWTLLEEVAPNDPRGHLGHALAIRQLNPYSEYSSQAEIARGEQAKQESITAFELAIKADPSLEASYLAYAEATLPFSRVASAMTASPPSDQEMASTIAILDRGLKALPASFELWMKRASYHHYHLDQAEALEDSQHALAIKPNDLALHKLRGEIFVALQDYDAAAKAYDLAHALSPDDAPLAEQRMLVLSHLKDKSRALQAANEIIARSPKNASAYYQRALLHLERKEYALALADVDTYKQLEPGEIWAKGAADLRARILAAQQAQ